MKHFNYIRLRKRMLGLEYFVICYYLRCDEMIDTVMEGKKEIRKKKMHCMQDQICFCVHEYVSNT